MAPDQTVSAQPHDEPMPQLETATREWLGVEPSTPAPEPASDASEHDPLALLAVLDLPELLLPDLFNANTLEVFQRMHIVLELDADRLDRHFELAQNFLSSQLGSPDEVAALMTFYRRYTEFELNQAVDPAPLWLEQPEDASAASALDEAKQEFRRAYFGRELADRVWGDALRDADHSRRVLALARDDAYGDDTALRAQLAQQLPDAPDEPAATNLPALNPALYITLVRNGEALLAMSDEERRRTVQAYRQETSAE
jgi:hypothetical protein